MGIPNFQSRTLFKGDNLPFLQGLNSETVDLIATDPPFNKSRDFHATPNSLASGAKFQDRWSWKDDVQLQWLLKIEKDEPEVSAAINAAKDIYGDDMGAFLCWLGVRLMECHRILKPTGSLYLHIDHTAHAYAKMLLDAIFGRDNFRNEIVWCYDKWTNTAAYFQQNHDNILFYTKGDNYTFNKAYHMTPNKEKVKARGFERNRVQGGIRQLMVYDWEKANMEIASKQEGYYARILDFTDREIGAAVPDHWSIPYLSSSAKERTGYPTQKPLALYERIIKASSNEGDIILDPFCGCATTPVAAERLSRQWVGMDLWDGCHDIILNRLNAEKRIWKPEHIKLVTVPPSRTDDGVNATEYLEMPDIQPKERHPSPRSQKPKLLADIGPFCQGCGRDYTDDPRVLEVDHKWPKAEGGTDAYENLTLLCGPCNKEKKDKLTLTQLQDLNRKNGQLTPEREQNIRPATRPAAPSRGRRRRR